MSFNEADGSLYSYQKMKKKYKFCDKSSLKCVLVGDSGVGKSNVAARLSSRNFKAEYQPTLFDNYAATVTLDDQPFHFSLFDTAGKENCDRLRVLAYMKCDVFLVCFSVADAGSLKSVETSWVPELRSYLPKTPFILVGTKTDLRDQQQTTNVTDTAPVTFKEATEVAQRVGAMSYVECSTLTGSGIDDVIRDTIEAVHRAEELSCKKGARKCCGCPVI